MSLLRWIWAYLFDCVHPHTTWPHQNQFGLAYVCCLDCGREMPYSLEYMQIVVQDRKRNRWDSRLPETAPLVIAGALLLLIPTYAAAQTAARSMLSRHGHRLQLRMHTEFDCQTSPRPGSSLLQLSRRAVYTRVDERH